MQHPNLYRATRDPLVPVVARILRRESPVVDINSVGVEAIEREGFRARRLQLGGVSQMDQWTPAPDSPECDIDVVFLGGSTDRRAAALARLAPVLWDRHSELRMFTFSRPLTGDEPGIVFGADKYRLLARSKVLVNLHRSDESEADGYFEWARMVEAMANGCVVVTEASLGHEPLVAGDHFVETSLDQLTPRCSTCWTTTTGVSGSPPLPITSS